MALDAVEPSADNREVQQQFQAEIQAACGFNVVRHGGTATATASGAASEVHFLHSLHVYVLHSLHLVQFLLAALTTCRTHLLHSQHWPYRWLPWRCG